MAVKRRYRIFLWLLLAGMVLANVAAFFQARGMTHFVPTGPRTGSVESLTWSQKLATALTGVNLPRPTLQHTPWDYGMDFATLTIPVDSQVTLDVWQITAPLSSGTVILFHGYGAAKSDLLEEARAFRGMGYSCWLVDFRGSGASTGDVTSIGYYEADDVAAVYRTCIRQNDTLPCILYGSSMGAAAILRAIAVYNLRPSAVVIEGVFDRMLTTVGNRFRIMGLPAFPLAEMLVLWGGVDQGFNAFSNNPVDYARRVPCPVLMLHGQLDRRATVGDARKVFANLPGVRQLVIFENVGHESCLHAVPAQWKDSVFSFLQRNAGK